MGGKVTFVRIPKNASTSITRRLGSMNSITKESCDATKKKVDRLNVFQSMSTRHPYLSESVSILGEDILSYPTFAVCRNPYDRMLSLYKFLRRSIGHFQAYLQLLSNFQFFLNVCYDLHKQDQDKMGDIVTSQSKFLDVDTDITILKFENLQNDFSAFVEKHQLDVDPNLDVINVTSKEKEVKHNESTREITRSLWAEDFERFGYEP
jgi:hypothetical protein